MRAARELLQQLGPEAKAVVNCAPGGTNTLLFRYKHNFKFTKSFINNNFFLSSACQLGRTEMATMLLQQGAEPRAHPVTGYTPLYTACHHGHVNTAKLLLEKYPELVQVIIP